jgi:hypothetical protein
VQSRFVPGLAGILLVLISLAVLAWGMWPVGRTSRQVSLHIPGSAAQGNYNVALTWPSRLRIGDGGVIRLVVEPTDPPPDFGSATKIIVKSRLEAVGLKAVPGGESLEPLLPGRQAVFYWKVFPERDDDPEAVIWVSLLSGPSEMDASASQALQDSQLLTAQKIVVRAEDLFGLDGRVVRLLGSIGIVFGLALCLDGYLLMKKYTWKEAGSGHA